MAWQKGPHAQAPQGVLCFPTEVPGEVTWDDEGLAEAAAQTGEEPAPPPPTHPPRHSSSRGPVENV